MALDPRGRKFPSGAMGEPALLQGHPGLRARVPHVELTARLPTPVHGLARLGERVGRPGLWIKRDDQTAAPYGGNKPRKLEFALAAARRAGRRAVLTFGGTGSHHALATAIYGKRLGLEVILVLLREPGAAVAEQNLRLLRTAGAEVYVERSIPAVAIRALRCLAREMGRGWRRPEILPAGGSSLLGNLGYVSAALELAAQVEAAELPPPERIFVPVGSAGTAAGLLAGLRLAGLPTELVGVLVTDILPPSARRIRRQASALGRLLARCGARPPRAGDPATVQCVLRTGYVGAGYAVPTPAGERAAALLAEAEGIVLDPTYSAKCFAALLDDPRPGPVVFWLTYAPPPHPAAID